MFYWKTKRTKVFNNGRWKVEA